MVPVALTVAVASLPGCTAHTSFPEPVAADARVVGVYFNPPAVFAGGPSVATVLLDKPAVAAGTLTVRSDSSAVSVPATVPIAAGANSATFTAGTAAVTSDANAVITVAAGASSFGGQLSVWAPLATAFSFVADLASPGLGFFGRLTSDTAAFAARNFGSDLTTEIQSGTSRFTIDFGVACGTPILPGTYEIRGAAAFRNPSQPGLEISGTNLACRSGRITVEQAQFNGPAVSRFVATFDLTCASPASNNHPMKGEIRLSNVALANRVQLPPCG